MKLIYILFLILVFPLFLFADNINVTQGSGKTLATDTIAGIEFQRFKLVTGADGTNGGDLSDSNRMPFKSNRSDQVDGTTTTPMTSTTITEIISASSGSKRTYIELIVCSNSHSTVGTDIEIRNGTTVRAYCPASPAYGGCVMPFQTPMRGEVDTAWNAKNVTTGASTRCTFSGFQIAE